MSNLLPKLRLLSWGLIALYGCRTGDPAAKTSSSERAEVACGAVQPELELNFAAVANMGGGSGVLRQGDGGGSGVLKEDTGGGSGVLKEDTGGGSGVLKKGQTSSFIDIFNCPEQARLALIENRPVIVFAGDWAVLSRTGEKQGKNSKKSAKTGTANGGGGQENDQEILSWLATEYPKSLLIDVRGDCARAIDAGDDKCLNRLRSRENFRNLVLNRDPRHETPRKSSFVALKTHIEKFESRFNEKIKKSYPLLFSDAKAKDVKKSLAGIRPEESYLLNVEQGIVNLETALGLLLADEAASEKSTVLLVGSGGGSEIIAEAVNAKATENSANWSTRLRTKFPQSQAVLFNLPGWTHWGRKILSDTVATGSPELERNYVHGRRFQDTPGSIPAIILNRRSDLRVESGNFFQYFALSRLFSERIAAAQFPALWIMQAPATADRIGALRRGDQTELIEPDHVLAADQEVSIGAEPVNVTMPYRNELAGAIEFDINLQNPLTDGQLVGLFQYGGCQAPGFPDPRSAEPMMPRAWVESKGGKLQLHVKLTYQKEDHHLTALDPERLDQLADGSWHRLRFEWQLPTHTTLPEVISITDLAAFFDETQQPSSKNLEILAWVTGSRLPTSFGFQQGVGRMSLSIDGEKVADSDIKPSDGARYFRPCLSRTETAQGRDLAFEGFGEQVQWEFVQGSLCKSNGTFKDFPVGLGCVNVEGAGLPGAGSIRGVRIQ